MRGVWTCRAPRHPQAVPARCPTRSPPPPPPAGAPTRRCGPAASRTLRERRRNAHPAHPAAPADDRRAAARRGFGEGGGLSPRHTPRPRATRPAHTRSHRRRGGCAYRPRLVPSCPTPPLDASSQPLRARHRWVGAAGGATAHSPARPPAPLPPAIAAKRAPPRIARQSPRRRGASRERGARDGGRAARPGRRGRRGGRPGWRRRHIWTRRDSPPPRSPAPPARPSAEATGWRGSCGRQRDTQAQRRGSGRAPLPPPPRPPVQLPGHPVSTVRR